jgi:hypothetical protein
VEWVVVLVLLLSVAYFFVAKHFLFVTDLFVRVHMVVELLVVASLVELLVFPFVVVNYFLCVKPFADCPLLGVYLFVMDLVVGVNIVVELFLAVYLDAELIVM